MLVFGVCSKVHVLANVVNRHRHVCGYSASIVYHKASIIMQQVD